MITVISATDRVGANTHVVATQIFESLTQKTTETVKFLSLEDLPAQFSGNAMYGKETIDPKIADLEDEFMVEANKFVFVIPEYNGSFPGILKLFIDACSIRDRNRIFKGKKAAVVGVASGRAGNLRGLEHFTGVLNYLGTVVSPNHLPISSVHTLIDKQTKHLHDAATIKILDAFSDEVIDF
ncbi:MAG: hypothetical protein RL757_2684 [Bacteroidota bacterium]|jgi:NAD(P)H-dependent FMN reductase